MANMNTKWVEQWHRQRSQGRSQYITKTGLAYGGLMFFGMTFLLSPPAELNATAILLRAAIWTGAGFVFGAAMWWYCEWRYKRVTQEAPR